MGPCHAPRDRYRPSVEDSSFDDNDEGSRAPSVRLSSCCAMRREWLLRTGAPVLNALLALDVQAREAARFVMDGSTGVMPLAVDVDPDEVRR